MNKGKDKDKGGEEGRGREIEMKEQGRRERGEEGEGGEGGRREREGGGRCFWKPHKTHYPGCRGLSLWEPVSPSWSDHCARHYQANHGHSVDHTAQERLNPKKCT